MKRSILFFLIQGLLLTGLFSCTKEAADDGIAAEDHANITSAADASVIDATSAAGQVRGISGKTDGGIQPLCGVASVDTGTGRQLVVTYDNTSLCKGMLRSGKVSVSVISGPFWRNAHAQLGITFSNLTFTNHITGASYALNGSYTVTNETGGLAWGIMAGLDQNTSVTHRIQADSLSVTFPNGAQRLWSVDRTIQFISVAANGNNVITEKITSENTNSEESWGVDRNGDMFQSYLITDVISNNNVSCPYKPYQGEYSQTVGGKSLDILYGVDDNGNPLNSPNGCAYGYKITYTSGKKILTKIVEYNF